MGDRAVTEVVIPGGSIYVYTHWGGSDAPELAREAIRASKVRREDINYATHIVLDTLLKPTRDQVTGCGVSLLKQQEDEYNGDEPSVVIDLITQRLIVIGHGDESGTWTFGTLDKSAQVV